MVGRSENIKLQQVMEFAEKTQLQQSSAFICCASEQQNDALKKIQKQYEVFTKMKKTEIC